MTRLAGPSDAFLRLAQMLTDNPNNIVLIVSVRRPLRPFWRPG
jgi:hypothetical protein|eukprot:COSAG01_NODE_8135_length_2908_cov_82.937147_2_plen_43_part_00